MAEYSKRKYYWIKLTDHFLTSDTVDFLLSQKDGANYVVLYQMLCLKSVNTDGLLASKIGEMLIPFDEEKIQRDCKHFSIDTIRIALGLYKKLGLVYTEENGCLRIARFDRLIGSQTEGARRKEIQRNNKVIEGGQGVDKCPLDIKRLDNRDKDIYIKKEINKEKKSSVPSKLETSISDIFNYWNAKKIIVHRELTEDIKRVAAKAIHKYGTDNIKKAIEHYAQIQNDESYYFNYKWSLKEFLKQSNCIPDFLDDGSKWVSYQNRKVDNAAGDFDQRVYANCDTSPVVNADEIENIEW